MKHIKRKHKHKRSKRNNVMAIYVRERVFHIPTPASMTGKGMVKDLWQDTLCGVKVQFRRQNCNWDWCKTCLMITQINTQRLVDDVHNVHSVSSKTKKQQAHHRIVIMTFQPSVSIIELIKGENGHVDT